MKISHDVQARIVSGLVLIGAFNGCSLVPHRAPVHTPENAFIAYWPPPHGSKRLRLAVKDLIDMKGVVTTAGCEYLAKTSPPALKDAACLENAREQKVDIVGKANLSEFALGVSGLNDYFGTPRNRLVRRKKLIPGGSSSGSAVAVASGMADISFATDTAGSVRVPAACCGILGLKTTFGLVPLRGVFSISSKHLDTVGPLAKDVSHLVQGMELLHKGAAAEYENAVALKPSGRDIKIGRLYVEGTQTVIDKAVDDSLAAKHFQVFRLGKKFTAQWKQAQDDGNMISVVDGWRHDRKYAYKEGVTGTTKAILTLGSLVPQQQYKEALKRKARWQHSLAAVFKKVDFIAVPTLQAAPPTVPFFGRSPLFEAGVLSIQNTAAVNFSGNPALAMPIPVKGGGRGFPVTSLQLVGPRFSEAKLMNAGRIIQLDH